MKELVVACLYKLCVRDGRNMCVTVVVCMFYLCMHAQLNVRACYLLYVHANCCEYVHRFSYVANHNKSSQSLSYSPCSPFSQPPSCTNDTAVLICCCHCHYVPNNVHRDTIILLLLFLDIKVDHIYHIIYFVSPLCELSSTLTLG